MKNNNKVKTKPGRKIKIGDPLLSEEIFDQELLKWLVIGSYPPAVRKTAINKKKHKTKINK